VIRNFPFWSDVSPLLCDGLFFLMVSICLLSNASVTHNSSSPKGRAVELILAPKTLFHRCEYPFLLISQIQHLALEPSCTALARNVCSRQDLDRHPVVLPVLKPWGAVNDLSCCFYTELQHCSRHSLTFPCPSCLFVFFFGRPWGRGRVPGPAVAKTLKQRG